MLAPDYVLISATLLAALDSRAVCVIYPLCKLKILAAPDERSDGYCWQQIQIRYSAEIVERTKRLGGVI